MRTAFFFNQKVYFSYFYTKTHLLKQQSQYMMDSTRNLRKCTFAPINEDLDWPVHLYNLFSVFASTI